MSTLHIYLLGGFRWTIDGVPLSPPPMPAQELLASLILRAGQPQRRADLAFAFWPNADQEGARSNLRKPLYALRRALPEPGRYLLDADQTLTWRADAPYTLEVDEFKAASASARSADEMERAVGLYTGDLLPGCYDDWIELDRQRLRHIFVRLLRRAIAERETAGDLERAVAYAHRWHVHDREDEEGKTLLQRLRQLALERADVVVPAAPGSSAAETDGRVMAGADRGSHVATAPAEVTASAPAPPPPVATDDAHQVPSPPTPVRPHRLQTVLVSVLATLLVAAFGFAFVQWWQAPAATLPAGGYRVTIQPATRAANAGTFVLVHGTSSGLPRRARIWTVVRAGTYFWPQQAAFRASDIWTGVARIGGSPADSGRDLDVLAVLATKEADDDLGAWLRLGYLTGAYPPLTTLPDGARIVATTSVHVK